MAGKRIAFLAVDTALGPPFVFEATCACPLVLNERRAGGLVSKLHFLRSGIEGPAAKMRCVELLVAKDK
jgi:hypothetical protein